MLQRSRFDRRDAPGGIDIVDCQFAGNVSNYAGAIRALGNLNLVRCEFIGNSGDDINGGALTIEGDVLLAKNCLFVGNSGRRRGGAICDRMAVVLKLIPLYVCRQSWLAVDDRVNSFSLGGGGGIDAVYRLGWSRSVHLGSSLRRRIPVVTHSNVQGGYPGEGNIDIDPLLRRSGLLGSERHDRSCRRRVSG